MQFRSWLHILGALLGFFFLFILNWTRSSGRRQKFEQTWIRLDSNLWSTPILILLPGYRALPECFLRCLNDRTGDDRTKTGHNLFLFIAGNGGNHRFHHHQHHQVHHQYPSKNTSEFSSQGPSSTHVLHFHSDHETSSSRIHQIRKSKKLHCCNPDHFVNAMYWM